MKNRFEGNLNFPNQGPEKNSSGNKPSKKERKVKSPRQLQDEVEKRRTHHDNPPPEDEEIRPNPLNTEDEEEDTL